MGKFKSQKNISSRLSPVSERISSSEPKTLVENLLAQLREPSQREKVAVYLANLEPEGELVQEIISSKLLQALGIHLLDSNLNVPLFIVGALRKMCDKHPSILEAVLDQGVMNPLCSLFKLHYDQPWMPSKVSFRVSTTFSKMCYDNKTALFIEAVTFLKNLIEATSKAVEIFNRLETFNIITKHIDEKFHSSKISSAVARFLYSLTDNNLKVCQYLKDSPISSDIHHLVMTETSPLIFKAAGTGILINISRNDETFDVGLVKVLLDILALDIAPQLESFIQAVIEFEKKTNEDVEEKENEDLDTNSFEKEEHLLEEKSDSILDIIIAKQISLEVLNNLCYSDDKNEDEWMNDDDDEECSEDPISEMDTDASPEESTSPLHDLLKSGELLKLTLRYTVPIPASMVPPLQSYEPLYQNLCQLRKTALLALPNFLDVGGDVNFADIWGSLSQTLHYNSDEYLQDKELLVALTCALRAVLPLALSQNSSLMDQVSESDLHMLFNFAKSATSDTLRVADTIVNILGSIGSSLTSHHPPSSYYHIVKSIAEFLLMMAQQAPSLAVLAECLNSLIDIFSHDSSHPLAAELHLPDKLAELQKHFRIQVKEKKREAKEHTALISTIKDNLSRFISYKKQYCS